MNRLLNCVELCLALVVLTLPFTMIPARYKIPILGESLPHGILLIALFFFCIYTIKEHKLIFFNNKYFIILFFWSLFCLILGFWKFPYYNVTIDEYLSHSKMTMFIVKIIPILQGNTLFLHVKMFCSLFWYMIRDFFFPFAGLYFIIFGLFQEGKKEELYQYLIHAVYGLSFLMVLYSIPEIIWLWTGNETCSWLLSSINVHLFDPAHYNGWWPPLLWAGQLRSVCLEPSYFGIIAAFLIPFLAIDFQKSVKPWKLLLLFFMVFMVFMTKARTAIVIYLGESAVLLFLSSYVCFPKWKRVLVVWVTITLGAFCVYLFGSSILHPKTNVETLTKKYIDENVTSVVGKDKRSNSARFGNTMALVKIGIDYPLTGVGMGLHSPYMKNRFPDFAKDNYEIKNWIKDMQEKSFLESGLPILNEYAAIFAWEGIVGLIFFLLPPLIVVKKGIFGKNKQPNFEFIGLVTALVGQLACMLSSEMFLTYPLTLWLLSCTLEKKEKEWSSS